MDLPAQDGHVLRTRGEALEFASLNHTDIPALFAGLERHLATSSRR
jgi:hypothetical protein